MRIETKGLNEAILKLEKTEIKVEDAAEEIVRRLSLMGYDVAYTVLQGHVYSGDTLGSLTIVEESPTRHVLMAASEAILFLEFGRGVIGGGHPLAKEFGMGPGTYPGQTHALDPNGWWYPTNDPVLGIRKNTSDNPEYQDYQYWGHTHGNEPRMPMYLAYAKMKDDLLTVAKEVLNGD